MANILYINHYAGRKDLGMEFRPHELAKEWIKSGHNTLIVGADYSHLRYNQPKAGNETHETVPYLWLRTPKYKGNGVMRLVNIFTFIFQLFFNTFYFTRKFKPDVVIASSTFHFDIFPAWLIARLSGATLVYEIHDLWPMAGIEIGRASKWHPFIISQSILEKVTYRITDKVVSIWPNTFIHVKKFGVKKENFAVVENGYSPTLKTFKSINKNKKLTVGYVGSIGATNAIENLIYAAEKTPNTNYILAGDGPYKVILEKMSKGLNNIKFIGSISKYKVQEFLSTVDITYIDIKSMPIHQFGVGKNKIFDYMQAGKPILYGVNPPNDPVIKSKCGFIFDSHDKDSLANLILKIEKMPKAKLTKMGENGRVYAQKYHQFPYLAQKFLKAILG